MRWEKAQAGDSAPPDEDADVHKLKVDTDANLLRLVMLACKRERPLCVLELCQLLRLPSSWNGAVQIAIRAKKNHLAERIREMSEAVAAGRTPTLQ